MQLTASCQILKANFHLGCEVLGVATVPDQWAHTDAPLRVDCGTLGSTMASQKKVPYTKVWFKSYGTALVKVRWNFSDQALWIGLCPLNFSEGSSLCQ